MQVFRFRLATGGGNSRISSRFLALTIDAYLLFVCHCSLIQNISENCVFIRAKFVAEAWLDSFIF